MLVSLLDVMRVMWLLEGEPNQIVFQSVMLVSLLDVMRMMWLLEGEPNQIVNGELRPLGFSSKALNAAQKNYSTFERELSAIYLAV